MYIRDNCDNKTTVNKWAKELVLQYGEGAFYWREKISGDGYTDKQVEAMQEAIEKHYYRVRKFLGL